MTAQEARLRRINEGRSAQFVKNQILDMIIDTQDRLIREKVSKYRGGTLTQEESVALVGALAALTELTIDLDTKISRGEQAEEDEHGKA